MLYLASHLSGCRTIANCFNRGHVGRASVGKSWVASFIKEHAAEIAELKRRRKRRRPASFLVNHTWGLDLTICSSNDGQKHQVLGIIDHGSRVLLRPQVLASKTALELLGHLFITFSRFGIPQSIRTDNEAMFTSRLWQVVFRALGVMHRRGPPAQPWRNGRIERLFGTMKQWLKAAAPANSAELQLSLNRFAFIYNHTRPHQGLKGLTPAEAWLGITWEDLERHVRREQERWRC